MFHHKKHWAKLEQFPSPDASIFFFAPQTNNTRITLIINNEYLYKQKWLFHVMQGKYDCWCYHESTWGVWTKVSFQKSLGHTETRGRNSITHTMEFQQIFSQRRWFSKLKNPHNITHTCWWYKLCVVWLWLWCISSKYNTKKKKKSGSRLNISKYRWLSGSKKSCCGERKMNLYKVKMLRLKMSQPQPQ